MLQALLMKATSMVRSLLAAVALASTPALAQEGSYRAFHLAYGSGIGAGFARYTNGRHGEGFAWGAYGRVGYRFSARFAIGGMLWADPLFAVQGSSSSGLPFSSAFAPGLRTGPALSFFLDRFTFVGALLFGA